MVDLAALVFAAAAADPGRPRAELALLARRYRDASDLARQLDP